MARLPQKGSAEEVRKPAPTGQDLNQRRQPGTEPSSDQKEAVLSAKEWFEKGRSLDNDSDAEIQYYQKAIEQDPKFAPAYYRLGAIYFRQADYDQAEQEFILFLQCASEAEKLAYNLDLYFPSDYLERLLEEQTAAQSPPEEPEEELAPEAETELAEEEVPEESPEASEEVETIIRFSTANGQMLVPALLNGAVNASLLFDTGAQITVLSRELAESLDIDERAGRTINLKTIASNIQGQVVTLDSILVGSSSRTDFPVAVVDLSPNQKTLFEGILGMDFLGNYAIRIDNQTRNIFLTPKRTTTRRR
jgi:predicted aspartyl protease